MRDLLKEFDNNVKVVKEWYNDDSGKPHEDFIVCINDKDFKTFRSMQKAMERASALSSRRNKVG